MNICLIGNSLISLTLAKALVNKNINVFLYSEKNIKNSNKNRTIGITSNNLDFIQKKIIKIKNRLTWKINQIEIYNSSNKEKILDFEDSKRTLFFMVKNNDLYNLLNQSLLKNKNFKKILINNKFFYNKIVDSKKFDLIINCDGSNEISKKFFYQKIVKNYKSNAYVTIINHDKIYNQKAVQIFTKKGPIAFLPISEKKTSVVYSIKNINNNSELSHYEFEDLILKNNNKYKINSINKFETIKLKSKTLRSYYHKNILAFGDMLHQIHPLSGQGFNMTLRDINIFIKLITDRKDLGLPIDYSIYKDFENKTKHLNFIFSYGNDFIYEFFNFDNFYSKIFSKKIFNYLNNNKLFNKVVVNYADKGLNF